MTASESRQKRQFVMSMFDDIHERYDLLNTILSLGQDSRWRERAIEATPNSGWVIDLCAGGGEMAYHLLSKGSFSGELVITDFSKKMLSLSAKILGKQFHGRFYKVICDAQKLPFKQSVFGAAISGFGLRNLTDLSRFSSELHRVLKSGGKARLLEIGHPENKIIARIFALYFFRLSPRIASLFTPKTYAYRYLPHSLRRFPPQGEVLARLADGWDYSSYENIMSGIAVIYTLAKSPERGISQD